MIENQKGFTIVELLLAMGVFSLVLVVIVTSFTQILQTYRAGVTAQKTQQANREIISQMTRDAHSARKIEAPILSNGNKAVCFDKKQYFFNQQNVFYSDNAADCSNLTGGARKMVSDELKVLVFVPEIVKNTEDTIPLGIDLRLTVGTNSDDLLNDTQTACDPTKKGSQYCATSTTNTSIGLRGAAE